MLSHAPVNFNLTSLHKLDTAVAGEKYCILSSFCQKGVFNYSLLECFSEVIFY